MAACHEGYDAMRSVTREGPQCDKDGNDRKMTGCLRDRWGSFHRQIDTYLRTIIHRTAPLATFYDWCCSVRAGLLRRTSPYYRTHGVAFD